MAVGDLVTTDWQMEFNGLLIGDTTDFSIATIAGLAELPPVRSHDQVLLRTDGASPGDDFIGSRTLIVSLEIDLRNSATTFDDFARAFVPGGTPQPMVMQIPQIAGGIKTRVYGRPRRRSAPINLEWLYELPVIIFEFDCADPRIYADAPVSHVGRTLAAATGGLTWPLTFPLDWGTFNAGTFTATNAGNVPAPAVFTFHGPLTTPRVENITQGSTLEFNIALSAGETLVVDTGARTALLNATASRSSALTAASVWFHIEDGDDLRFAASAGTGVMDGQWRSPWI